MAEMFEVFHGRFLLDQAVQGILEVHAPMRFPGWTANPTDCVVFPNLTVYEYVGDCCPSWPPTCEVVDLRKTDSAYVSS